MTLAKLVTKTGRTADGIMSNILLASIASELCHHSEPTELWYSVGALNHPSESVSMETANGIAVMLRPARMLHSRTIDVTAVCSAVIHPAGCPSSSAIAMSYNSCSPTINNTSQTYFTPRWVQSSYFVRMSVCLSVVCISHKVRGRT